jgi:hypothetical protein
MRERVSLQSGNITGCFMTHGTIKQFVRGDGYAHIIIIITISPEVVILKLRDCNKPSKQQQSARDKDSFFNHTYRYTFTTHIPQSVYS